MDKKYNIIYVEDDKEIVTLVDILLSSKNIILNTFVNFEDALEYIYNNHNKIDLLITDGKYPISNNPNKTYNDLFKSFEGLEEIMNNEKQKIKKRLIPGEILSLFVLNNYNKIKRMVVSSSLYSLEYFNLEVPKPFTSKELKEGINNLLCDEVYSIPEY